MAITDLGPLLAAIRSNDLARARELLAANKDWAAARDPNGVSTILLAKYQRADDIAQLLAEARGADLSLFEGAAIGDLMTVLQLLAKSPILVREHSPDGFTALHLAAFFGHPQVVETLLDQGADANQVSQNAMQLRPIHSAAAHSDGSLAQSICRILLGKGAEVNARQAGGYTALHSAAASGNLPLAKLLIGAGADRTLKSEKGETPSDLAKANKHDQMVALL